MRSVFNLEIARSIRGSLGRFLAIMGIVALGCGFFAGLKMTGPDMRSAADAYYDGLNLYDVRLVSTMGFEDADVSRVREVEGVEAVMPAKTLDAMASMGSQQVAVRVSSLNMDAAQGSTQVSSSEVSSSDSDYLNRPRLIEGQWPESSDQCVISADKLLGGVGIGDTVRLVSATSNLDDVVTVKEFTIVGLVSAPQYLYNGSFGSTTLGSGSIEQYLFVRNDAFAESVPYTELYLTVEGAREQEYGTDAYSEVVSAVTARLEDAEGELAQARLDDLTSSAQQKVDEAQQELDTNRADAERKLSEARATLESSRLELNDGWAQYTSGLNSYQTGQREFDRNEASALREITQAQATIDSNGRTLARTLDTLQLGEQKYASGLASYQEGVQQLLGQLGINSIDEADAALDAREASVASAVEEGLSGAQALQDAQEELDASISEAAATISQNEATLQEQEKQLTSQSGEIEEARDRVAEGEEQLTQALAAYGIEASTVEEAQTALENLLAQVDAGQVTLPAEAVQALRSALQNAEDLVAAKEQVAEYDAAEAQIEEGKQQIATARQELEERRAQGQAQIDAGTQELLQKLEGQGIEATSLTEAATALRDQRSNAELQLEQARAAVEELQEGRSSLEASRQQLDAGWSSYENGASQLAQGQATLNERSASAQEQLSAARAELERARVTLASSLSQLQSGEQSYQDGLAEYQESEEEAERQLAEAQSQVDEAQSEIDALEAPDIYTLDRTKCEGCATYEADTERMDHIAEVFPLIFFLVAALVALTTMTRMVESERIEIGTYKALGYGTARIASKYLAYAAVAGVVGAVVGILLLSQVLPYIITSAYSIIYAVPLHPFPLPINVGIALASGGLGVGVTLLATWWAVVSSLRETPATLMLPRAPKAGKRILLERLTALWDRISFSWKVTFRNLFRYKRRLFMTIVGIAGCTALLLTGFGLHDSIWDIIDCQYGPIIHYDTTVGMSSDATDKEVVAVENYLQSSGQLTNLVRVQGENLQVGSAGYDGTLRVNVIIPRNAEELEQAVTLRERVGHKTVPFDDSSVVLTEKAASLLGVRVGDSIKLYDQDAIGNATGEGTAFTVTGICENYVGNLVYLGRDAWSTMDADEPRFLTLLATTTQDQAFYDEAADALHQMGGVSTVAFSEETINLYRSMLSVVNMVVVVLIVSAALLAAIVLFNLTNVNISERIREIASLKVLGFTRREVYSYVFREIILLALLGDVVGMLLGVVLEQFVITAAEVDYVMFGRTIHAASFAISFGLTMVFTVVIMFLMRKKLDRVSMVESLKSID